jgi:hypothetical protein
MRRTNTSGGVIASSEFRLAAVSWSSSNARPPPAFPNPPYDPRAHIAGAAAREPVAEVLARAVSCADSGSWSATVRVRLLSIAPGAGRGGICLCRAIDAGGSAALPTGVQHEDAGHLRRLRLDHGGVRPQAARASAWVSCWSILRAVVLLYFVGRRFLDRAGAVAACAAYALLSLSPRVCRASTRTRRISWCWRRWAAIAGAAARAGKRAAGPAISGAARSSAWRFLMKQPGGAFAFFGASLLILWDGARGGDRRTGRRKARAWRLYAAGVAAPIVLTGVDSVAGRGVGQILVVDCHLRASVHATAHRLGGICQDNGWATISPLTSPGTWDELFWDAGAGGSWSPC